MRRTTLFSAMGLALMAALAPTVVLADTYPIEVPAYSTYYKYFPAQQGNAALGEWNATTTVANWTIGQSGQINWAWGGDAYQFAYGVEGDSAPSVEYSYTGGDCTIFGWWGIPGDEGTTGAIDVEVDGTSTTYTSPDNLGTLSTTHEIITTIPLEVAAHTIKITVRQGTFSFYGLQVQWEFPDVSTEQVTDMVNHPMVISTVAKNSTGDYVVNPAIDADYPFRIILGFGTIYYPRIYSPNTGSSWHYNIGLGNIFVRLNGTSSLAGSNYSVLVKPAPPNMSDTFNGWSWTQWAVTALPMFQANLDPNVNYTVKVTYTGSRTEQNQNPSVNFGTLETFQDMSLVTAKSDSSSTSSSSSAGSSGVSSGSSASTTGSSASSGGSSDTSQTTTASSNNGLTTGALVGAVIGALVGGILLTILGVWVFLRYRGANKETRYVRGGERFERIDDKPEAPTLPPPGFTVQNSQAWVGSVGGASPVSPATDITRWSEPSSSALSPGATASQHGRNPSLPATIGSMSTQPSGSRATELEVVMQEQDAGALERIGEPIQRIVPPSYDPSWMQPPPTPMASQATGGSHHSNSSKTWMDNYSNLMDGSGPR